MVSQAIHHPEFSPLIVLLLVLIVGASTAVYTLLVRRWTTQRYWVALEQWAGQRGFALARNKRPPLPKSLPELSQPQFQVSVALLKQGLWLLQLTVANHHYHLLVKATTSNWPATALRPVAHKPSLLDCFSLSSSPHPISTDRFLLFGEDLPAARTLANSSLLMLMPPDIGLLLRQTHLILDFSTRPFDAIEFDRMLCLADQLAAHLPVAPSPSTLRQ
jgi:hypothetical protein